MGDAPVLLVPCSQERAVPARETLPPSSDATYERELAYEQRIRGASVYPAVQNIILACRAFGLGTLITTNHIRCEDEVKAVLGLPADVSTYALMPIGYPEGKFGPLARKPVSQVAYADRCGRRLAELIDGGGFADERPSRESRRDGAPALVLLIPRPDVFSLLRPRLVPRLRPGALISGAM